MIDMSDSMKKIIDVSEEKDPKLVKNLLEISKKNNAILLTCIAPMWVEKSPQQKR